MKTIRNLFVLLLFVTLSCRESVIPELPKVESDFEYVTANEVPGLIEAIAPYVNPALSQRGDIASANQGDTYFGMSIDLEHIISRLDEEAEHTDFVMRLNDKDRNPFTFSNLVITRDESGQFYQPFIMRYEMTEEFGMQYFETGSIEGFSGTIKRGYLAPISASTGRLNKTADSEEPDDPNDYGSERDQPNIICEKEATLSGGEGELASTGGQAYEVCEVFEYTYYEYNDDGTKVKLYSVFSYENCYWEYPDQTSADSADCPEDNSEVPVNEPEKPAEPEEASDKPKKEYESKCQGIQELWNNYPENEISAFITNEGKLLFAAIGTIDEVDLFRPYLYQGQHYYIYPSSQGPPATEHAGLIEANGYFHIPITASIHTHPKCALRNRTDGLETISKKDKNYASEYPGMNHWIVGCDAVGRYRGGATEYSEKYVGLLDQTCNNLK